MMMRALLLAAAASADQFDLRKLQIHRDGDRLRYSYGDKDVSPWHDVPFWADADKTLVHFVCEIPRLTRSKLEIHKSVAGNKLVQDTKGPHPRFYKYSAAVVNYGAISQTWEDPAVADEHTGVGGDNDPIDVLQLNAAPCARGAVQRVRVLGALALVDGGETDWKLLVVDADDSSTSAWRTVDDVPRDRVAEARDWYRLYKTAEGKGENEYGMGGRAIDGDEALRVAVGTHDGSGATGSTARPSATSTASARQVVTLQEGRPHFFQQGLLDVFGV